VGDLILDTEGGCLLTGEVYPFIRDDSVREAEATHNILPQELGHLVPSDFVERYNFDLFCDVVGGD